MHCRIVKNFIHWKYNKSNIFQSDTIANVAKPYTISLLIFFVSIACFSRVSTSVFKDAFLFFISIPIKPIKCDIKLTAKTSVPHTNVLFYELGYCDEYEILKRTYHVRFSETNTGRSINAITNSAV